MPREYNAHGWWREPPTAGWSPPDPVSAPDEVGGLWRWPYPARTDKRVPNAPDWRVAGYPPQPPRTPPPAYRWSATPFWHWHGDTEMVEAVKAARIAAGLPV
jgi:hypothetical protein